jgi:flagellar motor switch protein FliM
MTTPAFLSQDEIDALLMGDASPDDYKAAENNDQELKPYNPATQHRVISDRLLALDIINERFARTFRMSLFNLLRRSADVTVKSVKYQSYSDFSRNMPVPSNLNLIAMKPLRGTALLAFPPKLVYMVVDNLFGGDGRFHIKTEGREFTATENRIIKRLVNQALDCYKNAWKAVFPLEIEYLRPEMQARFANVTSSPNEIIVNSTFHLEVGNSVNEFNIALPFLMIEPIRKLLSNPPSEIHPEEEAAWSTRVSSEIKESHVELSADFVTIQSILSDVMQLEVGDILPIDLPDEVIARVDGVPVLTCDYGNQNGVRALRVSSILSHEPIASHSSSNFLPGAIQ